MVTCTTDLRTSGLDCAQEGQRSLVFGQTAGTFWFYGVIMCIPISLPCHAFVLVYKGPVLVYTSLRRYPVVIVPR